MMSKQNVPELRFPEFSGEWEEVKFDEIFSERSDKTSNLAKYPLYSLTVEDGITPKSARYNREFLVKKEGNFKLVDQGNIVYNPMNVTLGAIDISRYPFTISVSGYYYVMTVSDNYSTYFMKNYLKINKMINHYKKIATGSLIEKQRVHFSEFKKIKKPLPGIEEQNKIGEFLSKLDRLIELEEKKLELLEEQKKGYMQKIFSQELRFKDENSNGYPEWEKVKLQDIFEYERPDQYIVSTTEYLKQGLPVLTANKAFVLGYTEENNYYDKGNCIIFDDFTLDNKYVNFPFKVKSSAIKILTTKKNYNINFAYYLLNQTKFIKEGHARHYISVIQPTKVKTPCEKEQKKIGEYLRKLDKLHEYHRNKIKLLNREKNGLLQKLFI